MVQAIMLLKTDNLTNKLLHRRVSSTLFQSHIRLIIVFKFLRWYSKVRTSAFTIDRVRLHNSSV